jgi:hypothetical protein
VAADQISFKMANSKTSGADCFFCRRISSDHSEIRHGQNPGNGSMIFFGNKRVISKCISGKEVNENCKHSLNSVWVSVFPPRERQYRDEWHILGEGCIQFCQIAVHSKFRSKIFGGKFLFPSTFILFVHKRPLSYKDSGPKAIFNPSGGNVLSKT